MDKQIKSSIKQQKKNHRKNVNSEIVVFANNQPLHFKSVIEKCKQDLKALHSPINEYKPGLVKINKTLNDAQKIDKSKYGYQTQLSFSNIQNISCTRHKDKDKSLNHNLKSTDIYGDNIANLSKRSTIKKPKKSRNTKINSQKIAQNVMKIILNKNNQKQINLQELKLLVKYIVREQSSKSSKRQQRYNQFKKEKVISKKNNQICQIPISKLTSIRSINNSTYDLMQLDDNQIQCFNKPTIQLIKQMSGKNQPIEEYCIEQIHTLQTLCFNDLQNNEILSKQDQAAKQTMTIIQQYLYNQPPLQNKSFFKTNFKQKNNVLVRNNQLYNIEYEESQDNQNNQNLQVIINALRDREKILIQKKNHDVNGLLEKQKQKIITKEQFEREKKKIQEWTNRQILQIQNTLSQIVQGEQKIRGLLDSDQNIQFEQENPSSYTLDNCLSELTNQISKIQQFTNPILFNTPEQAVKAPNVSLETSPCPKTKQLNLLHQLNTQQIGIIIQFIFMDLMIQIYVQNQQNQKFVNNMRQKIIFNRKISSRQGINLEHKKIVQFLTKFEEFCLQKYNNLQFLSNLQTPLGPTAREILRFIRQDNLNQSNDQQNIELQTVLSSTLFKQFLQIWIGNEQTQLWGKSQNLEKARVIFLKQCLEVFYKAIFDSINEYLDSKRIFGRLGRTYPWKLKPNFEQTYSYGQKKSILKQSINDVTHDLSYFCGIITDKQFSRLNNNNCFSQNDFIQLREDRLNRMLADELMQTQYLWYFYDDDETELIFQLNQKIQYEIFQELLFQIKQILKEKKSF